MEPHLDHTDRLFFKRSCDLWLSSSEKAKARALARQLDGDNKFTRERLYFEPYVRRGLGGGPMLIFGDVREISLFASQGADLLEYRLSSLARTGDTVVLATVRDPDFEHYRMNTLGFGSPDYLETAQYTGESVNSTPKTCLRDPAVYSELVENLRGKQCETVLAHITTGTIWALGRKLGMDLGRQMQIAGPLPTLSRMVNNKLWFSRVATELLGQNTVPNELPVYGLAALTAAVMSLARTSDMLVVKVPDSAGSKGNFVLSCQDLRDLDVQGVHRFLTSVLEPVPESIRFPLMVQIWEREVLLSPSIQIWIPDTNEGPPIVEGLFKQNLDRLNARFAGATKASLSAELEEKFTRQGLMLATLFQELGYFGRCSFDAIISGSDLATASLHWIECNGRWGGVSVPLTLMNTLFRRTRAPEMFIYHAPGVSERRQSFAEGCKKLKPLLWSKERQNGVIFLTPSGFSQGENLHFVAVASTLKKAQRLAERTVDRLATDQ